MALFRFEHHTRPVATHARFLGRLAANLLAAALIISVALAIGMIGYRATEHMSWLLLGGMGPVNTLATDAGKLFAGLYALACGLLFVLISGVVLAPVLHRVLHALKVDDGASS
jgi:hypothetical protein